MIGQTMNDSCTLEILSICPMIGFINVAFIICLIYCEKTDRLVDYVSNTKIADSGDTPTEANTVHLTNFCAGKPAAQGLSFVFILNTDLFVLVFATGTPAAQGLSFVFILNINLFVLVFPLSLLEISFAMRPFWIMLPSSNLNVSSSNFGGKLRNVAYHI